MDPETYEPFPGVAVDLESAFGWTSTRRAGLTWHQAGHLGCDEALAETLAAGGEHAIDRAGALLRREHGHFACIVEAPGFIFATVDRVRSYPVFYAANTGRGAVSNSARSAQRIAGCDEVDPDALLEFAMAGFVTGQDTLYRHLHQLQSGEFLLWRRGEEKPAVKRYYQYLPAPFEGPEEPALIEELGNVIDRVIARTVEQAGGAPIWLPLSGGLDSRLILAKLVQSGYPKIQSFSYGVWNNHEATMARRIARKLGVPWFQLASNPRRAKALYDSPRRRAYSAYADGLCSVPKFLDLEAFDRLTHEARIPTDAVVVNGQTGDYITGNHIPVRLIECPKLNTRQVLAAIIDKHFSLWPELNTPDNLDIIEGRILSLLPKPGDNLGEREKLFAQYEAWEWQERQAKGVVNAQRIYEHYGLRWCLPLWDGELMDFFEKVPFRHKIRQALYISYLRRYNFRGVFDTLGSTRHNWPFQRRWIQWTGQLIGLTAGRQVKEAFYQRMLYYGKDHGQYAMFGHRCYLTHYKRARSVTSLAVDRWLTENGLPRATDVLSGESIAQAGDD